MISLQQLRVILAVRANGSLTKAANALHYGVPTVTHHLDALESRLGARLVERTPRGARLTPIGELLAEEGEQILARVAHAERLVATYRDAGAMTLVVGTFPSIGSRLLPEAIRALRESMHVEVELVEGEPTELVRMLGEGALHAAIIYDLEGDPAFDAPDLESTLLMSEPFHVLVGARSPLARLDELDLGELGRNWIGSRNDDEASQRVLRRASAALGQELHVFTRTDDLNMIHGLVAADLAVALTVPSTLVPGFGVVARPSVQELGMRRLAFVTRGDGQPPALARLREILVEAAAELATATAVATAVRPRTPDRR
ncbi:LysR family transcriptional regulator [Agromyces sp. NPDC058104]|uniref:LysR family transcriptional regulator n=1 Tax=Agromyces sp. NPDC058104 TaxID=3346342 RepID=UPI0036DE333F